MRLSACDYIFFYVNPLLKSGHIEVRHPVRTLSPQSSEASQFLARKIWPLWHFVCDTVLIGRFAGRVSKRDKLFRKR
jgi:hypothetical protein